jgi:C4-dicarboxylate-specific signal transduction histidine kinase
MLNAPYMVSAAFLSMVFAFTWVIARDVIRATTLTRELSEARHEAELLMRSNLLGEVASAMAHELNQPLAAILSNAQAAQKFMDLPAPDMDEIRDILDDVVRDDKRARDIILNLRHMLEGDEEAQQDVNLEAAIREMLEFIRQEFKDHAVKVEIDSTGQIPLVRGGRVGVQQVILNLVLNAKHALLEASSPDPVIHIRLRASHDGAEVEVRDFGPGIANSVRHRIFQPFVSTRDDGLGMGLAISRRIVEAQGGSLTVDDVHEGGGALFRLWLPAANR